MSVTFRVNGKSTTVDVPGDMPLLWVLRDVLDLKGTKYGCGIGECSACLVHLDGEPAHACMTSISSVQGSDVVTIEGLSANGDHPLQRAWEEVDVPQCGYCQAGQIMAAAALLRDHPHPTDDDIDRAMDANICRCLSYGKIREAIHRAAKAGVSQ